MLVKRDVLRVWMALWLTACGGGGGGGGGEGGGGAGGSGPEPDSGSGPGPSPDAARDSAPVDIGPEISVEPVTIDLTAAVAAPSEPFAVVIANQGTDPLSLSRLDIEGSEAFALTDAPALPAVVAPGTRLTIHVVYTPPDAAGHEGTFVIGSDDADEAEIRLPITGRIARSCVRTAPGSVELGPVERGSRSGVFRLQVINCGDVPLPIVAVRIEGDMHFAWDPESGVDPAGTSLPAGEAIAFGISYVNEALDENQPAVGELVVEGAGGQELARVSLNARGARIGCALAVTPDRVDFGVLRIGLARSLEIEVTNVGTAPCALRGVFFEDESGPEANTFRVTRMLAGEEMAAGASGTFELTYRAEEADPRGDRVTVYVNWFDGERMENRRVTAQVFGVAAEALIGGDPDGLNFGRVTAPRCASRRLDMAAANVGQVPLCVTGYRFEGDDCGRFFVLEQPEVGECLNLEASEGADFAFQYQPDAVGDDECTLIVTSDAMNTGELRLVIRGEGVDSDATTDTFEVGRLDANQRANFDLSRIAVEDSVRVFVNDEPNDRWGFDERRNVVFFNRGRHPDEGDDLRVEYDARCFDRR